MAIENSKKCTTTNALTKVLHDMLDMSNSTHTAPCSATGNAEVS